MDLQLVDPGDDRATAGLADLLVDVVDGGASVGFLAPLPVADAERWWQGAVRAPGVLTLVGRDGQDRAAGVVQLRLVGNPNGLHRAEVAKLLVHRSARSQGLASALLERIEREALARGRWLLILDTETGSPAQHLYERRGWARAGVVEDYALDPSGRLHPTTFMTKVLRAAA